METTRISVPLAEYESLLRVLLAASGSLGSAELVDIREALCNEALPYRTHRTWAIREYDGRVT